VVSNTSVLVLGVGAFAHSTTQILKDAGASVATYFTRNFGHYPPSLVGPVFSRDQHPSPAGILKQRAVDVIVPMSIDWAQAPWCQEVMDLKIPIFSPVGEAMRIERERDFARELCARFHVPFPRSFVARNRLEAESILHQHPLPFVIKNPLCSPTSPIHTILCETLEDTQSWLRHVDYAEGVFLQEYLGRREVGHIALISGGEIYPLVTNQEYKRAFAGNMGVVAGAPLGGLVEKDPDDKYGLARELLYPLLPWFREVNYNGPIQVTAVFCRGKWHVIEYNIRIGVTSGAMILRMLTNPLQTVLGSARNEKIAPEFIPDMNFGCSVTLAGYGYPYVQVRGPQFPIEVTGSFDCDVWWNEVNRGPDGGLLSTGHRIADVIAFGSSLPDAMQKSYENIRKIRSLGSYYRPDVGQSLWPPGNA
jgi:phosphoribosylamine--glycine ligase